jgi:hypothetical protein
MAPRGGVKLSIKTLYTKVLIILLIILYSQMYSQLINYLIVINYCLININKVITILLVRLLLS